MRRPPPKKTSIFRGLLVCRTRGGRSMDGQAARKGGGPGVCIFKHLLLEVPLMPDQPPGQGAGRPNTHSRQYPGPCSRKSQRRAGDMVVEGTINLRIQAPPIVGRPQTQRTLRATKTNRGTRTSWSAVCSRPTGNFWEKARQGMGSGSRARAGLLSQSAGPFFGPARIWRPIPTNQSSYVPARNGRVRPIVRQDRGDRPFSN